MNFYFAFTVTCFTLAIGDTLAANPVSRALQSAPQVCQVGEDVVSISILTDKYPEETSWTFYDTCSEVEIMSGGMYGNSNYLYTEDDFCVEADGAYTFEISDSYSDGICCDEGNGSYTVSVGGEIQTGGDFNDVETKTFGCCNAEDSTSSYQNKNCAWVAQNPNGRCSMCSGSICAIDYCTTTCNSCELDDVITTVPSTVPSTAPTVDASCNSTELVVSITIVTDNYPQETSWIFSDTCSGAEIMSGGSYANSNSEYVWEGCVPEVGAYTFDIYDSGDDGMCCTFGVGSYDVLVGAEFETGGQFESVEQKNFGLVCEDVIQDGNESGECGEDDDDC